METTEIRMDSVPKLVGDIWGSMLGMEITPTVTGGEAAIAGYYTAWVRVIGSQNITVILRCPDLLARKAVAAMFSCPLEEVAPDQIRDGLKEIVNILGGNLKGMMTKYHFLSMPAVSEPDREPRFPTGDIIGQFNFQSQGQGLQLTLLKVD